MYYKRTTISFGSTGVKSVSTTSTPRALRITIGSRQGNVDSVNHLSVGNSGGTSQSYHSTYSDGSGHQTVSGTDKIASHYERVSGNLTEVISARIDSTNAAWTATAVKFVVDATDANYQFHVEIWGD